MFLSFIIPPPVKAASFCRTWSDRTICILSIKRSAKYYWQYLASVSINGVEREQEVYNCRDRFRIQKDGNVESFEPHGAGELICRSLKK
jgi:hypothetical protein